MTRTFGIRPVERPDLARLAEMIAALATHHGDCVQPTVERLEAELFGDAPLFHVLVACANGSLVGYASVSPRGQFQTLRRGGEVDNLYVEADWRGKGVGRALVEAAGVLIRSWGGDVLFIGTDRENTGAQSAYRAMGMEERPPPGPRFRLVL